MKTALRIVLSTAIGLLLAEGLLRVQQKLGPGCDLEFADLAHSNVSEILNHKPPPLLHWTLHDERIYCEQAGLSYDIRRDSLGLRINSLRPRPDTSSFTTLFMGDSFVEGYDDPHTLVQVVHERLLAGNVIDGNARTCNAGHSSYAPSILTAQARLLIPEVHPDMVVVVIDQSDLGDDVLRYEHLVVRDDRGRIVAVRPSPTSLAQVRGLEAARDEPLYLGRLLRKLYHTRIYMPIFCEGYHSLFPGDVYVFARDRDADTDTHARELAIFGRNLADLADTLLELTGSPERILFVSHPHLQNLSPEPEGFLWRDLVAPAVAAAAIPRGIAVYDATADLRDRFAGDPASFYWPGDIHFNFEGFRIYGELIADRLGPRIEALR